MTGPPPCRRLLAVCADPDDLADLSAPVKEFAASGAVVKILILTHGEIGTSPRRRFERASELARAAAALGAEEVDLLDHPAGRLTTVGRTRLIDDTSHAAAGSDVILCVSGGRTSTRERAAVLAAAREAARRVGSTVILADPRDVAARSGS
ncbi:MAG TPA: PIG-L family deacetylase [Jiangellaceae bacterium]